MLKLWDKDKERDFFSKSLEFATPEKLFYKTTDGRFLAYWPKKYAGTKNTLQSRNAFIGAYTEKWTTDLFSEISEIAGGYSVQGVIAENIGLTNQSPADVAICKTKDIIQKPENIIMLLEVKMSVVWNWEFIQGKRELLCICDYKTHSGNPGLLRSDTMLKAIGKSINIRVSDFSASKIPIIIIGNTPISETYHEKADQLKRSGIIQGFWSVNPHPVDSNFDILKTTKYKGFYRFDNYEELKQNVLCLLTEKREFFSSMKTRKHLGEIIEISNKEQSYEAKAEKFLKLLRQTG